MRRIVASLSAVLMLAAVTAVAQEKMKDPPKSGHEGKAKAGGVKSAATPASTSRSPPTPGQIRISLSASRSQAYRSVMIEIEVGQCPSRMSASAATAGGVQDEISNLLRVSDKRQVTGVHLDRLRMHTVCEETLQLRRRGSILLRYGIRRRLEFPRCCGRPRGEQRVGDPPLNRVEHTRLGRIDAAGEVLEEGLLAQLGEAARFDEAGICRWRGKFGSQCRIVLVGVRRASSDVDKGGDCGINPGLADDGCGSARPAISPSSRGTSGTPLSI